jgi:hypothetical protein
MNIHSHTVKINKLLAERTSITDGPMRDMAELHRVAQINTEVAKLKDERAAMMRAELDN